MANSYNQNLGPGGWASIVRNAKEITLRAFAVANDTKLAWDAYLDGRTSSEVAIEWGHTRDSGTAQAGAADSITLAATASASDDEYNGDVVWISSGTGAGQEAVITDYVGSTKVASATFSTAPDATSVYTVVGPQAYDTDQASVDLNKIRRVGLGQVAHTPASDLLDNARKFV